MKTIFGFTILIFSMSAFATPAKIEMIFLSPEKVVQLLELIEKKNNDAVVLGFLAQTDQELKNCVPMGDGCFDPQLGYIEKKPDPSFKTLVVPKDLELKLRTFNAVETSLVTCDKGNYFDIYCGKEKANKKPAEIEIWFDISSSLRTVDYNKDPEHCSRRSFMTKVTEGCKDKVRVSVYNTSLKEIGDLSGVCMAYGTNDEDRLIRWMKESKAKHLLIVTDIDEMSRGMKDFLESQGAKLTGDGVRAFTSADLVEYSKDFTKLCK